MDNLAQAGMPSNRAEMLSIAVRANMRRKRDLPIALALQPVAAVAWAVVDGLADEQQLFEAALEAQGKLALRVGAFPERGLLGQVIADCAPEEHVIEIDNDHVLPSPDAPAQREVA